jgi:ATP-binding protein involved in chromosome partitioning
MKIALPLAEGQLCMHFGHCQQFALVDVDPQSKTIRNTEYLTPPPHEPGVLPRWLAEQGAELVIAGGMGQRAQALFSQSGVKVVVGAPAGDPEPIVRDFLSQQLQLGQNVCGH